MFTVLVTVSETCFEGLPASRIQVASLRTSSLHITFH